MGPLEFLVLAFPGTGLAPDLVESLRRARHGDIRVIDSLLVVKGADGLVETSELPGSPDAALIDEEDALEAATALEPDSTGLILLVEHVWAGEAAELVRAAGGRIAASVRVPDAYVEEALT